VYKKKFDDVSKIKIGKLKRKGDKIMEIIMGIDNNDKMDKVEKYEYGNIVLLDFMGEFMIRWYEEIGIIINKFDMDV
jgi:hypothetical protein